MSSEEKKTQKIDRKAFEEYQEKEKNKNICLYKVAIGIMITINVIFVFFYVTYRRQISNMKDGIDEIMRDISDLQQKSKDLERQANKKVINLYGSPFVNKNLILTLFSNKEEFTQILSWSGLEKRKLSLCFKYSYDGDDPETFHDYCYGSDLLVLIQSKRGHRFGFYTSNISLKEEEELVYDDPNAFLFNLDTLKKYTSADGKGIVSLSKDKFFTLGDEDLVVGESSYSKFPRKFGSSTDKTADLIGEEESFEIEEMEVLTSYE